MIDLHTHSSASDGSVRPRDLAALAARAGIRILALTDHDTIAGVAEFLEAAREAPGLQGIGGIEISAVHVFRDGAGREKSLHAHLLGYGGPGASERFSSRLEDFRKARDARGARIVERLQQMGFDITLEEALAKTGGGVFGRPHIAAAMVEKGIVHGIQEAFDEYLTEGAKAYVERERPTAIEAIQTLRDENSVPVLAHPPTMRLTEAELDRLIGELRPAGLMGIEGYYPNYTRADVDQMQTLAARHGLLRTGGSDFHGEAKPEIVLGKGLGNLRIPDELGRKLLRAIEKMRDEK